jgi:hypothetical protein
VGPAGRLLSDTLHHRRRHPRHLRAHRRRHRRHLVLQGGGRALAQVRRPDRGDLQRRRLGLQRRPHPLLLGPLLHHHQRQQRDRRLRLLPAPQHLRVRRGGDHQRRDLHPGRLERDAEPDPQHRRARRERARSPTTAPPAPTRPSSSASATRSRRASASPGTSTTASGSSTAATASTTTSPSTRCRAAPSAATSGSTTSTRLDNPDFSPE